MSQAMIQYAKSRCTDKNWPLRLGLTAAEIGEAAKGVNGHRVEVEKKTYCPLCDREHEFTLHLDAETVKRARELARTEHRNGKPAADLPSPALDALRGPSLGPKSDFDAFRSLTPSLVEHPVSVTPQIQLDHSRPHGSLSLAAELYHSGARQARKGGAGCLERAERQLRESIKLFDAHERERSAAYARAQLAKVLIDRGGDDRREIKELLDAAQRVCDERDKDLCAWVDDLRAEIGRSR